MNKEEMITFLESAMAATKNTTVMSQHSFAIYMLRQLEEPQQKKVVVPSIMAKHIEQCKSSRLTIRDALNQALLDTESEEDLYSKAWLAYPNIQISEDRLFRVKVGKVLYFVEYDDIRPVFVIDDSPGAIEQAHLFDHEKHAKECAEELGGTYEEATL